MHLNQKVLKDQINMEDFLESHSGSYFIIGTFKKNFECKFGNKKIKQCNIDTNKLQPNVFDESTVKEICTELNKIKKCEIQEFLFETYLECMKMPGTWGGKHEINVISELLEAAIIVSQKDLKEYALYNKEKKYCNKIYLSYEGWQHYQFYQVKHSNLIKFVLSFVQSFEMKLTIYDVLANTLRQENRVFFDGVDTNNFVLSIFGFSAHAGSRIMPDERASLQIGHVIKATKSFVSLSDLIETFNQYKLGFRKVLVDAGCDIFQSFEMQFEKIGFNYVSKVVDDITDKIIEYYVQKEHTGDFNHIWIAEALVLNKYLQEMPGEIVQYGEKNYNLRDLYENIGVVERHKSSFIYYRKNNKDSQYGYRCSLIGEKSKEVYDTKYTRVQTTNLELENYVYAIDPQDFKDIVKLVFYIVNKEIYIPNTKRFEGFIVKIKSHIEREVSFLNKHILSCYQECKRNLDMHMKSLEFSKDIKWLKKAEKNSDIISLMEKHLKTIPNSFYYQKVKEAFVSHAEVIRQDYNNLFELQCDDTVESRNLWSCIKASSVKTLALMFKRMDFKGVCAPVEEFTGRQEQINDIYRKLQEGAVVIVGPSGIGKTQLARKFVEENKGVYLNVYEVNTQDMLSIESSFTSFVRDKLAMSMKEDKERKKHLFLFQGAKKEDVEKILEIRGQRGGFDCLFTSSNHGYQDISEVTLDNLEEEQTIQFVKKILETSDRSQDNQIEALVKKLKGFPSAVKQAAMCIKNKKLGEVFGICEYLTQYEEFDQILPRSAGESEYDRVLKITSLISIEAIQKINSSEEINQILNAIAYLGSSQIDPYLFFDWVKDEDKLYSIFELLEQYSLLYAEEDGDYKVYIMHELVRKAIRSQINVEEEKQVLRHAIKLLSEIDEGSLDGGCSADKYLSLFNHSRKHKDLLRENQELFPTVLGYLNKFRWYKKVAEFVQDSRELLVCTVKDETSKFILYEYAYALANLGSYDNALEIFKDFKEAEKKDRIFPFLILDKQILSTYLKQKNYTGALLYIRDNDFTIERSLKDKDCARYILNIITYLDIVTIVAEIFVMCKRYPDAFMTLHLTKQLNDVVFLKKRSCDANSDPYDYLQNDCIHRSMRFDYIFALATFFIIKDRKWIRVNEVMLPHKEDVLTFPFEMTRLFSFLEDVLKGTEKFRSLSSDVYCIIKNVDDLRILQLKREALGRFTRVLQRWKNCQENCKDYCDEDNSSVVLSARLCIASLRSDLGERKEALQELRKLREDVISLDHPDIDIIDAVIQEMLSHKQREEYLSKEQLFENKIPLDAGLQLVGSSCLSQDLDEEEIMKIDSVELFLYIYNQDVEKRKQLMCKYSKMPNILSLYDKVSFRENEGSMCVSRSDVERIFNGQQQTVNANDRVPSQSGVVDLRESAISRLQTIDTENIQAKRRKIDSQQPVSSCLDSVDIGSRRQQDAIVNL